MRCWLCNALRLRASTATAESDWRLFSAPVYNVPSLSSVRVRPLRSQAASVLRTCGVCVLNLRLCGSRLHLGRPSERTML